MFEQKTPEQKLPCGPVLDCVNTTTYMEVQGQAEFIEVKSPIDRFKEEWAKLSGKALFRQRKLVLQNPDLVQYAELARIQGWKQPLMFALQGLLLATFFLSAFGWLITRDEGRHADRIARVQDELASQLKTDEAVIDAAQFEMGRVETSRKTSGFTVASSTNLTREEAIQQLNALIDETKNSQEEYKRHAAVKVQNLRAGGDAFALVACGTPVVFSLALIFAAPLFRKLMQKPYGRYRLAGQADSYYLYFVTSRGLWLNLGLVIVLNAVLSGSAYGLSGVSEAIGAIGRILFWLAVYSLLIYWFYIVSKDLHKAMQLPRIQDYAGLENKVLLHLHNSFWAAFLVFEAPLALLSYGVYLLERAR